MPCGSNRIAFAFQEAFAEIDKALSEACTWHRFAVAHCFRIHLTPPFCRDTSQRGSRHLAPPVRRRAPIRSRYFTGGPLRTRIAGNSRIGAPSAGSPLARSTGGKGSDISGRPDFDTQHFNHNHESTPKDRIFSSAGAAICVITLAPFMLLAAHVVLDRHVRLPGTHCSPPTTPDHNLHSSL